MLDLDVRRPGGHLVVSGRVCDWTCLQFDKSSSPAYAQLGRTLVSMHEVCILIM